MVSVWSIFVLALSCTPRNETDGMGGTGPALSVDSAAIVDGSPDDGSAESSSVDMERPRFIAPPETLEGEMSYDEGARPLEIGDEGSWGPPVRIDAEPNEHVGARLDFEPPTASVVLELLRWDGHGARSLGETNWGPGLRTLAALDPFERRTFWFRARGSIPAGTVTITRTPRVIGPRCRDDCLRLVQLPLPLQPERQGYRIASTAVYAYLFGRLEVVMAVLHAGRRVAAAGVPPFEVKRLSRWDGGTPPNHHSHEDGVDVDISLYRSNGETVWYPLCRDAQGRCRRGTRWELGGKQMAVLLAGLFASPLFRNATPRSSLVLIDRDFHREIRRRADELLERRQMTPEIHELFSPRRHLLRHADDHHHHIHVRMRRAEEAR